MIEKIKDINRVRGFLCDDGISQTFEITHYDNITHMMIQNSRACDKSVFLEFKGDEEFERFLSKLKRAYDMVSK